MPGSGRNRLNDAIAFVMSRVRPVPRDYAARGASGLAPIEGLLERLGDPHRDLACVHVAGSKGKGSVAIYTEAVLREAGLGTGLYTSPHLEDWTERVRVAGRNIPAAAFARAIELTRPHVLELDAHAPGAAPGFFDVLTAAAFVAFREAGVEVAVLETGLGGRLDATNVCAPAATCITSIELEHTDKLGPTLADVAREKAGIVKRGVPLVTGPLPGAAETVIAKRAAALDARRLRFGRELKLDVTECGEDALSLEIDVDTARVNVRLPSPSPVHARNAALALALARVSGLAAGAALDRGARALEHTTLPGRIEFLARRPWVVVDGAHTVASVAALAQALDRLPAGERRAVVSVSRGRDAASLLAPVIAGAARLYAVAPDPERSMPAHTLAEQLAEAYPKATVSAAASMRDALARARERLRADGLVVVTGSVYAAGAARRELAGG